MNPAASLLATTVISLGATLLVLVVATPAAYYVARFRFPGRLVFLLLGAVSVFAAVYTVIVALTAAFLVAAGRKWFREIAALGRMG